MNEKLKSKFSTRVLNFFAFSQFEISRSSIQKRVKKHDL